MIKITSLKIEAYPAVLTNFSEYVSVSSTFDEYVKTSSQIAEYINQNIYMEDS